MPLYICPSSRHLPTRLLQLCPLRLPSSTLQPLSSVLHTAARLIKDLSPRDHITPPLKQLYWLHIHARITFKISLLMYHIHSIYIYISSFYFKSLLTDRNKLQRVII